MNIFILFLVTLVMAGYYMFSAPSTRVEHHETEYAVTRADMRSIAECTASVHVGEMNETPFDDVCVTQNKIQTSRICLNARGAVTKCEIVRGKKTDASYIVTAAAPIEPSDYNAMLEIMEEYYPDAPTFGIYNNGAIMSGATGTPVEIAKNLVGEMKLEPGQLIYVTQYEMPDVEIPFATPDAGDITCPGGTIKTYRFGRWQCIGINTKTTCAGDTIWDSDTSQCVPDDTRRPLCAERQTAVMVDDVWECIDPFSDKTCPTGMTARLNYTTLEWECVTEPVIGPDEKKCESTRYSAVYGPLGATLRIPTTSCTDCEEPITDTNTCITYCIPAAAKVNDPKCYPGGATSCRGSNRAFYFGFPTHAYAARVPDVAGRNIPLDDTHSQNRRFNCLDCGDRGIDTKRSFPPYIAVCNE